MQCALNEGPSAFHYRCVAVTLSAKSRVKKKQVTIYLSVIIAFNIEQVACIQVANDPPLVMKWREFSFLYAFSMRVHLLVCVFELKTRSVKVENFQTNFRFKDTKRLVLSNYMF